VNETLTDIEAGGKPVIHVFNKIDALENRSILASLLQNYPNAVAVSAARGINMSALDELLKRLVEHSITEETLTLAQTDHDLLSWLHEVAEVLDTQFEADHITVRLRIRQADLDQVRKTLAGRQ
jgi:GTPase